LWLSWTGKHAGCIKGDFATAGSRRIQSSEPHIVSSKIIGALPRDGVPEFEIHDGRRQNAVSKVAEELRHAFNSLAAEPPKERAEVGAVVGVRKNQKLLHVAVEDPPDKSIEGLSAGA
jgi:hypothetical protein